MAVVRVGYLRMISVSQTAASRKVPVEHIVKSFDMDGTYWRHVSKSNEDGWPVIAACGSTFMGMVKLSRYEPFHRAPYPQMRSDSIPRKCDNCERVRRRTLEMRYEVIISTPTWESQVKRVGTTEAVMF